MTEGASEQGRQVGRIRSRFASWLAWSLAALSLVLFVAAIMLYVATRSVQPPTSSWGTGGDSAVLILVLPFLAFPLVGALIASRRPKNPIGWICLAVGNFWMLAMATGVYGTYGLVANPGSVPFPAGIGSLTAWTWAPAVGLLGTYLILLFPDGRLPSRRWRPLAWLSGMVIVLFSVTEGLAPGPLPDLGGVRNPFGLEGHPWLAVAGTVVVTLLPLCILASALSLVLRFLRSGGEEREQIKWLAFAASVVGVGFFSFMIESFLVADATAGDRPLWEKLLEDAMTLSFAGVPVAVGVAVLKYRLYDIDLVINRALVYGALTILLVAIYFGGILLSQRLFVVLTGEKSTLAVVASTLAIAALFTPLRHRIQSFIDRRFYRRKYDAAKTLEAFSTKLRDATDLDALNAELVRVVKETMQPQHVSLWSRPHTTRKSERAG